MSLQYDNYLIGHKTNVMAGLKWMKENIPQIFEDGIDYEWQIGMNHDLSKIQPDEYGPYETYFYGGNRSYAVKKAFEEAWLMHIHRNPHHWQHWVLINDDPKEGMVILDMPDNYIIEMICDWWSFSWTTGKLDEIFKWYDEHQEYMKLSFGTRLKVESILKLIREKLEEQKDES